MRSVKRPDNDAVAATSRRGFVRAVAGGSLIAGLDALRGTLSMSAQADAPSSAEPVLAGTWRSDEATRDAYAQDYGQIIHERPLAVVRPSSVDDIIETVRFARRRGLSIAARGQGHQPFGQAQVRDGIVLDLRSLQRVHSVETDRAHVDVGAEWRSVVHATLQHARIPPVLPAHLGLTVGGTLSIGGFGVGSFRHGAQIDQALELEVVTGEGEVVGCSARRHPALFEAALAGQGRVAIITRAQLRLIAARPMTREYVLRYADVPTLLRDQAALLGDERFDGVVALVVPGEHGWTFSLVATRQFAPPNPPDDAAALAGLNAIRDQTQQRDVDTAQYLDAYPNMQFGGAQHADLGLLIPGSAAARFIEGVLPRLHPDDLGGANALRVFTWDRACFGRPLLRMPDAQIVVYLAMLRAETADPSMLARMLAGNRALFDAARELGGTLYPFSALELTKDDWRRHYGESWKSLRSAKRRYDPSDVFASGPDSLR